MNTRTRLCTLILRRAACTLPLVLSACVTEYNFTRATQERGTFGEEVYQVLYQDAEWSPRDPQSRQMLLARERQQIVKALDLMVPEDVLRPLDELLRTLAPLQDSELIPDLTRKVAGILEEIATQTDVHHTLVNRRSRRHDREFVW